MVLDALYLFHTQRTVNIPVGPSGLGISISVSYNVMCALETIAPQSVCVFVSDA